MPKLKTHRGADKRFAKTASGKFKHRRGFRNHILTKKSTKRLRHLREGGIVNASDTEAVRRMLPYS
ncbi:MAG: 50S ribosomal protein L35 [Chromatiales bacterium]|jgi:large subunit ribosomal protein L35|nr:50S ribosomal protein L35 [Chromatiales bacterium]